ncbi:MAG TPA: DUF1707 domain-containing protein [Streptosporangiaceae bacterium]
MTTEPGPRVTDAAREAAAARLREHYTQGRLTLEEFHRRLDAAFGATTQSQLTAITRDLPRTEPAALLPSTATGNGRERARQQRRPGSRAWLVVIPAIIAVLAAWLLAAGLHLGMFIWPGRIALFLMIFAVIRWLVRFLWGLGRGGGRW